MTSTAFAATRQRTAATSHVEGGDELLQTLVFDPEVLGHQLHRPARPGRTSGAVGTGHRAATVPDET
ncbi:hypothetical protein MN205_13155 [Kineococcus sp. TRM81007]|uniref:hypothetical protein n=1 Tax=Kineococcus sp. TRM81007 TaxID=2925831 RepID=UPI001F55BF64|nr:hypothetical protein [Kineococcus sp. TRM81007]MCI2239438.1 hypothetical protein [Kineococcus sp. TRM81007]